jgi:uncharacterized membrane protein YdbT with pleckstrin-like domain
MNKPLVSCKKHWSALIPTGIIALLLLLAAPKVKEWYICVLLAVILCIVDYLIVQATCLELTASEVIGKTGVIKSARLAAPVSRVQDVAISNGLLGKILGYHAVTISTAGTDRKEFVFKNVTNGAEFQRKFLELSRS